MAHAQKPYFVFRRNGRVHLNRRGRQFSRLLTAEVCASAVVMLDTQCSAVVWRVLATHSIRQFPLYFPSRVSPCAITFQLDSKIRQHWARLDHPVYSPELVSMCCNLSVPMQLHSARSHTEQLWANGNGSSWMVVNESARCLPLSCMVSKPWTLSYGCSV
jgi:hypothetical protein